MKTIWIFFCDLYAECFCFFIHDHDVKDIFSDVKAKCGKEHKMHHSQCIKKHQ